MATTAHPAHRNYEPPSEYARRLKCYNALLKIGPSITKAALPEAKIIRDPNPDETKVIPRFTLKFEQQDPTPEAVAAVKGRILSIRDKIYVNYDQTKKELGVWLPLDAIEIHSSRESAAVSVYNLLNKKVPRPKQASSPLPVPQEKTNNQISNNLNSETMAKSKSDGLLQRIKDHNKKEGFTSSKDYVSIVGPNKKGHVVVNCRNEVSAKKMAHSYDVAGLADNVSLPEGKKVIHLWDGPVEEKATKPSKKNEPKTKKVKVKKSGKKKTTPKTSVPKKQKRERAGELSLSDELRMLADRAEEVEKQEDSGNAAETLENVPSLVWDFLHKEYGNGGNLIFVTTQPGTPVATLNEKKFIKGLANYLKKG